MANRRMTPLLPVIIGLVISGWFFSSLARAGPDETGAPNQPAPVEEHMSYLPAINNPAAPYPTWLGRYGVDDQVSTTAIIATNDGGFLLTGVSWSSRYPGLAVKLNQHGDIEWQKSYQVGGSITNPAEGADGSLLVASLSSIYEAAQVIKQRPDGGVIWKVGLHTDAVGRAYGGGLDEVDGGAVVAVKMTNNAWLWRITRDGKTAWTYRYGPADSQNLHAVQHTVDGGFVVAGWTIGFGASGQDAWVLKLDQDGGIAWQYRYGGRQFTSISQTGDGGYIAAGDNGGAGWLVRLAADGSIVWSKSISVGDDDYLWSVKPTGRGDYIATGSSRSGDLLSPPRGWAVRLDDSGQILWQRLYDLGPPHLAGVDVVLAGGLVFGGQDVDALVLRTDAGGNLPHCGAIDFLVGASTDYPITRTATTAGRVAIDAPSGGIATYVVDAVLTRKPACPTGAAKPICEG